MESVEVFIDFVLQESGADVVDLVDSEDSDEFYDPVVDKLEGFKEESGNVEVAVSGGEGKRRM